jgi:hypothetical protein
VAGPVGPPVRLGGRPTPANGCPQRIGKRPSQDFSWESDCSIHAFRIRIGSLPTSPVIAGHLDRVRGWSCRAVRLLWTCGCRPTFKVGPRKGVVPVVAVGESEGTCSGRPPTPTPPSSTAPSLQPEAPTTGQPPPTVSNRLSHSRCQRIGLSPAELSWCDLSRALTPSGIMATRRQARRDLPEKDIPSSTPTTKYGLVEDMSLTHQCSSQPPTLQSLQITMNGLIELHRRVARGFRNYDNYRLRMLLIGGGLQNSRHGELNHAVSGWPFDAVCEGQVGAWVSGRAVGQLGA